jgi:hypothetical protein
VILLIALVETVVGTPDFGSLCSRTSFEPHPGEIPAAGNSLESQTAQPTAGT